MLLTGSQDVFDRKQPTCHVPWPETTLQNRPIERFRSAGSPRSCLVNGNTYKSHVYLLLTPAQSGRRGTGSKDARLDGGEPGNGETRGDRDPLQGGPRRPGAASGGRSLADERPAGAARAAAVSAAARRLRGAARAGLRPRRC